MTASILLSHLPLDQVLCFILTVTSHLQRATRVPAPEANRGHRYQHCGASGGEDLENDVGLSRSGLLGVVVFSCIDPMTANPLGEC
jgi:hypothetical protein